MAHKFPSAGALLSRRRSQKSSHGERRGLRSSPFDSRMLGNLAFLSPPEADVDTDDYVR